MNAEQVAQKLIKASENRPYKGTLSKFALQSIKSGKVVYSAANLLAFCEGYGLKMAMVDQATLQRFYPNSVLEIHNTLKYLMERYEVDCNLVYRKTAVHYTPCKASTQEELDRLTEEAQIKKAESAKEVKKSKKKPKDKAYLAPLSIKSLLAVCEVISCDLEFEQK